MSADNIKHYSGDVIRKTGYSATGNVRSQRSSVEIVPATESISCQEHPGSRVTKIGRGLLTFYMCTPQGGRSHKISITKA